MNEGGLETEEPIPALVEMLDDLAEKRGAVVERNDCKLDLYQCNLLHCSFPPSQDGELRALDVELQERRLIRAEYFAAEFVESRQSTGLGPDVRRSRLG